MYIKILNILFLLFLALLSGFKAGIANAWFANKIPLYECPTVRCDSSCVKSKISIEPHANKKDMNVFIKFFQDEKPIGNQNFEKCSIYDNTNWSCTDLGNNSVNNVQMTDGKFNQMFLFHLSNKTTQKNWCSK
jgi:hypothetical protein